MTGSDTWTLFQETAHGGFAIVIKVEVNVPDLADMFLGPPVRFGLERVGGEIDIIALRIAVAQPGLEFARSQMLGRANPLHRGSGSSIQHNHGQPVGILEIGQNVVTSEISVHGLLLPEQTQKLVAIVRREISFNL
jgi:hypothetical protein